MTLHRAWTVGQDSLASARLRVAHALLGWQDGLFAPRPVGRPVVGTSAWAAFGIRDPSLLTDEHGMPIEDENGDWWLYFNARDRPLTEGGITRVGLAKGNPASWRIGARPVFEDSKYAAQGSVILAGSDDYRMYYSPDTSVGIRIARSEDGVTWTRIDRVLLRPGDFAASRIGLPNVSWINGRWFMLLEGIVGKSFRILGASSDDGVDWTPVLQGAPIYRPPAQGWDRLGQANPALHVISEALGARYALIYNGSVEEATWDLGLLLTEDLEGPWRSCDRALLTRGALPRWEGRRLEGGRAFHTPDGSVGLMFFVLPGKDSYSGGRIEFATFEATEVDSTRGRAP